MLIEKNLKSKIYLICSIYSRMQSVHKFGKVSFCYVPLRENWGFSLMVFFVNVTNSQELQIWSNLLKKFSMGNLIICAMYVAPYIASSENGKFTIRHTQTVLKSLLYLHAKSRIWKSVLDCGHCNVFIFIIVFLSSLWYFFMIIKKCKASRKK